MTTLDPDEYQHSAARTLLDSPETTPSGGELMRAWCAMGLAGEAGELANLVKKEVFHRHDRDDAKVADELGDVLWYVAALCTLYGLSLTDIMRANIGKIGARYPRGYTNRDSVARRDTRSSARTRRK